MPLHSRAARTTGQSTGQDSYARAPFRSGGRHRHRIPPLRATPRHWPAGPGPGRRTGPLMAAPAVRLPRLEGLLGSRLDQVTESHPDREPRHQTC